MRSRISSIYFRSCRRGGPSSWPRDRPGRLHLPENRLEEDLRHEATHALARGAYGDLPLWLDEGLAEYFETQADAPDAQNEHLAKIREDLRQGWTPDLPRLESLTDIHQMTPRDYREAWGWVHLMLGGDRPSDSLLVNYLISAAKTQAKTRSRKSWPPAEQRPNRWSPTFKASGRPSWPENLWQRRKNGFSAFKTGGKQPRLSACRASLLKRIGSWLGF